jgi:hypothetical protein
LADLKKGKVKKRENKEIFETGSHYVGVAQAGLELEILPQHAKLELQVYATIPGW